MEQSPNDFPEVSSRNFESSHRKDPESKCSPDGFGKLSSRNRESSHRNDSVLEESTNYFSEVSNGKFESSQSKDSDDSKLRDTNFESADTKDSKIDGRSRSRTVKQINAYKKNFSKGHSIHWKLQELDARLRHLQSLVLSMR